MKKNDFGVKKLAALAIGAGLVFPVAAVRAESIPSNAAASRVRDDSLSAADIQWMDELNDDGELDSPYTWPIVMAGNKNAPLVRAVQYLLRSHGYTLAVDGKFGAQTSKRLKQFQAKLKKRGRGTDKYIAVSGDLSEDDWTWESLVVPIRRNSKSANAVRAAQVLLRAQGYPVALDGKFGQETYDAVRTFQAESHLTVDGFIGTQTWCVLLGGKVENYGQNDGTRE
jgi:peptidoglycan hydrolase-like protein with peptidoglycan-binding domain